MGLFSSSSSVVNVKQDAKVDYRPTVLSTINQEIVPRGIQPGPSSTNLSFGASSSRVVGLDNQFPSAGELVQEASGAIGIPPGYFLIALAVLVLFLLSKR